MNYTRAETTDINPALSDVAGGSPAPAHVIPANAGIQCNRLLGPGFRRGDGQKLAYCSAFFDFPSAAQKGIKAKFLPLPVPLT